MEAILFWTLAALVVAMGAVIVAHRQPIACALALVTAFFGLGVLFISLEAFFLAMVQMIVYAGAVMALFIFIIMLLDVKNGEKKKIPRLQAGMVGLIVVLFGVFFIGVLACLMNQNALLVWKEQAMGANTAQIGKLLFTGYTLPFLATGILLLVATMGVVLLNRKDL